MFIKFFKSIEADLRFWFPKRYTVTEFKLSLLKSAIRYNDNNKSIISILEEELANKKDGSTKEHIMFDMLEYQTSSTAVYDFVNEYCNSHDSTL